MADRIQEAGLSSGSSAAVHKAHCIPVRLTCLWEFVLKNETKMQAAANNSVND